MSEDWCGGYEHDTQLCVFDEFHGQKTIQFLCHFLQGGSMALKMKNVSYFSKAPDENPACIILSNSTLEECYAKAVGISSSRLDPLYARLEVVTLTNPIDLDNIVFNYGFEPVVPVVPVVLNGKEQEESDK